ncbi:unnamed protein product, partial [Didymodactylos carnosus]
MDKKTKIVDVRDLNTPDNWIVRDPELIRLTGNHPFNCELPLTKLLQCSFWTPIRLHFVRNHGYVPKIDWNEHRVRVCGTL